MSAKARKPTPVPPAPVPGTRTLQEVDIGLQGVLDGIGYVGKDRQAGSGKWGYAYRGIDDALSVLQPLLTKNELTLKPIYSEFNMEKITVSGKNGDRDEFLVSVKLELHALSSRDGSIALIATTYGTGIDSGDKAVYKAKSGAFKYAVFQAFSIPTEEMKDAETDSPKVVHKPLSGDDQLILDAWSDKLKNVKDEADLKACRQEMTALPSAIKKELYKPYQEATQKLSK